MNVERATVGPSLHHGEVVGPIGLTPDVELQIAGVPAAAVGELLERVGAVVLLRRNDIDVSDGENGVLARFGRRPSRVARADERPQA